MSIAVPPTCLQGDLGARRSKYEARWHTFASASAGACISYASVPWLVDDLSEDPERLSAFILYGAVEATERKKRLRLELMRWHPDKFTAKFGRRLAEADKVTILERVKAISQLLNNLNVS